MFYAANILRKIFPLDLTLKAPVSTATGLVSHLEGGEHTKPWSEKNDVIKIHKSRVGVSSAETQIIDKGKKRGQIGDPVTYQIHKAFL